MNDLGLEHGNENEAFAPNNDFSRMLSAAISNYRQPGQPAQSIERLQTRQNNSFSSKRNDFNDGLLFDENSWVRSNSKAFDFSHPDQSTQSFEEPPSPSLGQNTSKNGLTADGFGVGGGVLRKDTRAAPSHKVKTPPSKPVESDAYFLQGIEKCLQENPT